MERTVEELEKTVAQLPQDQLRQFRAWYQNFDSEVWDEQIEEDIEAGKLDALAEVAIANHNIGESDKL